MEKSEDKGRENMGVQSRSRANDGTCIPLTVITGNKNKFQEIVAILADEHVRQKHSYLFSLLFFCFFSMRKDIYNCLTNIFSFVSSCYCSRHHRFVMRISICQNIREMRNSLLHKNVNMPPEWSAVRLLLRIVVFGNVCVQPEPGIGKVML